MKDKIILFVIGILIGAVISTGAIYIYSITTKSNECSSQNSMNGGNPPQMNNSNGQPPEMNNNSNNNQPPEKPGDNDTQNSK